MYPAGSICIFTAVPKDVAIARFEQAPITITHGIGLIPSDNAIAIQIGVSIAAVALFDMMFVSTLVSIAITTVRSTTDAFFPPKRLSTAFAINAPPPDSSSPVPIPDIVPIHTKTSQGRSEYAFLIEIQPVPSTIAAPIRPIVAMLK
mgnify:FL=1